MNTIIVEPTALPDVALATSADIVDWNLQRLGKFTSSRIDKLLQSGRSKTEYWGKGAMTYIREVAAEIITQEPIRDLGNLKAVQWGNENEPLAAEALRKKYPEFEYYGKESPKFFEYEAEPDFAGGSPDGVIPEYDATNDGLQRAGQQVVEIKCPENSEKHIQYSLMSAGRDLLDLNSEYYGQIQFNMMCTGSTSGLFVSFDPRCKIPGTELFVLEIPADAEYQEQLRERIPAAIRELKKIFAKLVPPDNE